MNKDIDWGGLGLGCFAVCFCIFVLAGMHISRPPVYGNDVAEQERVFKMCMNSLPAGPNSTVYNDWDEVVESCKGLASTVSRVCVARCEQ